MKKSRWIGFGKWLIIFFLIVLFINALLFFRELKRDVMYGSRSYGLDTMNELFDDGRYYEVYLHSVANKYAEDELSVDVSQFEAFGRYYHYHMKALVHKDDVRYEQLMAEEKEKITLRKILNVIETLEMERKEAEG